VRSPDCLPPFYGRLHGSGPLDACHVVDLYYIPLITFYVEVA
jgi:hypothetical protein